MAVVIAMLMTEISRTTTTTATTTIIIIIIIIIITIAALTAITHTLKTANRAPHTQPAFLKSTQGPPLTSSSSRAYSESHPRSSLKPF